MFDPPSPYDNDQVTYDAIVVDFDGSLLLIQSAEREIRHPRERQG